MYGSLFFGEDTLGAAKSDYLNHYLNAGYFVNNILKSLLIYDTYDAAHSPIYLIWISFFIKHSIDDIFFKLFSLNLNVLTIIIFYNSLKIIFGSKYKKNLLILASVIFLSPTFRSSSIWPDSFLAGFIFFNASVYFFLKFKFKERKKFKNSILNTIFLSLSSYISPNFSLFVIYFFIEYFLYYKLSKSLCFLILLNLILASPAIYYVFGLEIYFFSTRGRYNDFTPILSLKNFSNKFIIFPTIVFFHYFILIFIDDNPIKKVKIKKLLFELVFFSLIILIVSFSFDYQNTYKNLGGGGFFYKISNFIFGNNIFLYFISLISLIFLNNFLIKNNIKNILILLIIIFSYPQARIYHQYFDLTLLVAIICLLNINLNKNIFEKPKKIFLFYFSFLIFWVMSFLKISLTDGIMKIF